MKSRPNCRRVLVYSGTVNVHERKWNSLKKDPYFEALEWSEMFARARKFYAHYEAVLEGDVGAPDFAKKQTEVGRTRQILESGSSHRSKADRKRGVGDTNV